MSRITPTIFLGGYQHAMDRDWLKRNQITHILNCTVEHPNYFTSLFKYLKLGLMDNLEQDLYRSLESAYRFILEGSTGGNKIYIHCHAGISRSVSMLIYFLMKRDKMSFNRALAFIRERRPIANPNNHFVSQLIRLDPDIQRRRIDYVRPVYY